MKRFATFWSTALALVLGICAVLTASPARAQVDTNAEPELSKDWSVRIGLFFPQSQSVRSKVGDIGISGHVERRVYAGTSFDLLVGIGYNGLNDVYSIPLTLNIVTTQHNLRYGAGVGYAYGKRLDARGTSGPLIDLILGYQLTHTTNPLSLDVRYYFISGSGNELDGYSFTLGYKF